MSLQLFNIELCRALLHTKIEIKYNFFKQEPAEIKHQVKIAHRLCFNQVNTKQCVLQRIIGPSKFNALFRHER